MLFNSFVFLFVFLPIAYLVFWRLSSAQLRYVWLAVTGYVFYGYWDPRFCLLMAFSTLVSYGAGLAFLRYQSPRSRRLALVVPISVDLTLLGFFKYAGFGIRSAEWVLNVAGFAILLPTPDIVLPVGISFYTFHTITYIVDCYRRAIQPTRNIWEFAAYVSLFSQLVAGPIVRFRQIERDLQDIGSADRTRWIKLGASFFVIGLVEKVLIADSLAGFVNPAFKAHEALSSWGAWLAILAYTFQLYFDFCGYSGMAVGLGYLFGLRIPQNFNSPYKAVNPSDFWRRWHISLSTCLRDYLYVPLGGNRKGGLATYRNLMLTMLIGGLWHGAHWTFVIWGAYHGVLLIGYRLFAPSWDRLPRPIGQLLTFVLTVIGWVFFRAETFHVAGGFLSKMFTPTSGITPDNLPALYVLLVIAGYWSMVGRNSWEWNERREWNLADCVLLAIAFGACLAAIASGRDSPFLYFQF